MMTMMNRMANRLVVLIPLLGVLLFGLALPASAGTGAARGSVHRNGRIVFFAPDPFWYYPYGYYPYEPGLYAYRAAPTTGTLKLQVKPENVAPAEVYVNGALASQFTNKHNLRLEPGEYRIEVRRAGQRSVEQTVRVIAGETLRLDFNLAAGA